MSNDQLRLIFVTDLMIHNMESVTSARYTLLHIDEAMNDIISLMILNNYINKNNNHHILSHIIVFYNICGKLLKYLNMYLRRLYNIISTDAQNTSAQPVGHDRTGLCGHTPSIQHGNNLNCAKMLLMKVSIISHIIKH